MSRLVFAKLALVVVLMCGMAGSASAQLSGILSGETKPADLEKQKFLAPDIAKQLPRLGADFTILSPSGNSKNAFGHVLGKNEWINPEMGSAENPLMKIDSLFSASGYRRLDFIDASHQRGSQKIVVYGKMKPDGDIESVTAAALQEADGTWSAKVGSLAVIGFKKMEQLTGPAYGGVVAVYERQTQLRPSPFVVR